MNITIGDTPEQLGSCLTADAVMIDGSVITKQQIAELMAQNAELVAQVEQMKLIVAVHERELPNLLNKADGEDKFYLPLSIAMNTIADAKELRKKEILKIQAAAGRAGFIAGAVCARHPLKPSAVEIKESADQYAEKVRSGEA